MINITSENQCELTENLYSQSVQSVKTSYNKINWSYSVVGYKNQHKLIITFSLIVNRMLC